MIRLPLLSTASADAEGFNRPYLDNVRLGAE